MFQFNRLIFIMLNINRHKGSDVFELRCSSAIRPRVLARNLGLCCRSDPSVSDFGRTSQLYPFLGYFYVRHHHDRLYLIHIKKVRGQHAELGDLFSQFKSGLYLKSVGASLLTAIYTFLWTLLFVIPGIIKSYSYSMTYFILLDHPEYTVNEAITKAGKSWTGTKQNYLCCNSLFWDGFFYAVLSPLVLSAFFG